MTGLVGFCDVRHGGPQTQEGVLSTARQGRSRQPLMLAAQTGDPAAIERLLAVCQADAQRYAYKHCHASDVDDAVQESLLIVARRVESLKAAAAFSSWLFTVIKRQYHRLLHTMLRTDQFDDEHTENLLAARTDEALRIDLAAALESLPAHYLEVVLLRDFEELTIAEIADRLGENAGAIKSRLHRARELVREYLLSSPA